MTGSRSGLRAAWSCAVLVLLLPGSAHAYHPLQSFQKSVSEGGGNGLYFTGSPRWKGYDCSICHVEPAGEISFSIRSEPPELIEDQRWEAGVEYLLTVRLEGEHLVHETNVNSFLMEIDTDEDEPVGEYFGDGLQDVPDVHGKAVDGVVAGRAVDTEWLFWWVAPAEGQGRLTLYLAGLDGNGAGEAGDADEDLHTDPYGDDVGTVRLRICEGAADCDLGFRDDVALQGGCSTAGERPGKGRSSLVWLVAFAGALVRRITCPADEPAAGERSLRGQRRRDAPGDGRGAVRRGQAGRPHQLHRRDRDPPGRSLCRRADPLR